MNKQYFHLTLGPVQGFVAQARRSRDYWAGSFILSWLAGVAILSVKEQDGKISFPIPDEDFLNAIKQGSESKNTPKQGGIPNRFKTEGLSVEVGSDFDPEKVLADIQAAWLAMAEVVWQEDLEPFLSESDYDKQQAKSIWDRQVGSFWDISWVLTEHKDESNSLDRRKNWRTHYQPQEFGSKCMMMDGYQELSGTVQPHIAKSGKFWNELRQSKMIKSAAVDFNEGEQLCALAYVKRRFARFFQNLQTTLPSGITINGWKFSHNATTNSPIHVPSLPYLAAVPWISKVASLATDETGTSITEAFNLFAANADEAFGLPSSNVYFNALDHVDSAEWSGLDGMSFFPEMMLSDKAYKSEKSKQAVKQATASAFKTLKKSVNIAAPSPFYALLIMDGDSLGKQMSDASKQLDISQALNDFTNKVQQVVPDNNGFLIYAGGDDVLALLPMEYALDCAIAVKKCYDLCFKGKKAFSTISAGIQYAHIKTPLMKIIKNAHSLLDDVAKDETGRNSIAMRIHKPGGLHAQWSMPWAKLLSDDNALNLVVNELSQTDNITMTNGWLMRSFDLLNELKDSAGNLVVDEEALKALITQEYIHSGTLSGNQATQKANAQKQVGQLISLCKKIKRTTDAGVPEQFNDDDGCQGYQADAIKIVRFLATKGVQD
jgi:CRISPR-associated protein Cmr2